MFAVSQKGTQFFDFSQPVGPIPGFYLMSRQPEPDAATPQKARPHPFGPNQPRWRVWLLRGIVFSVTFAMLMGAFSALGVIVEKFFLAIYTD